MRIFTSFMNKVFETTDPHVEKIKDSSLRDIARVFLPAFGMIIFAWLVSMPFGLVEKILDALVKISAVAA